MTWSAVGCLLAAAAPGANVVARAAEIPFRYVLIDDDGPQDVWQKSTGDLNGDGRVDLIAGGRASGGLVWYENPEWTPHTIAPGGGHSTDGEVADVDRDGDNDLVSLTTSEIRWYENPGWKAHRIDVRRLHDLEVADFDGDGDVDLVARDQGEFGHRGDVLHFYRQDSPTRWTHRAVEIPNGEGLATADLDRDGDSDVVLEKHWLENTGDFFGGPIPRHVYTTSWTYSNAFVATGDVNGDGRLDVVLSPSELAGRTYRISWFEAPADPKSGNWAEHVVEDGVEAVHHFIGAADMDGDGDIDVATAEMHQGEDPDEVKIYVNGQRGRAWSKVVLATAGSHSMRLVDFDADGDVDLFGANHKGGKIELWENLTRQPPQEGLAFIDTSFENASPLYWEPDPDGTIQVYLLYDQERSSPNRAAGHWHFQIQARTGSDLTIVLNNFDNVWNGKKGSPVGDETICFGSHDGRAWHAIPMEQIEGNRLKFQVQMGQPTLYVARLEPYRISDLEKLEAAIREHPMVEISPIGRTVQGRELEIIRVGRPDAAWRVLLRARAHAWEPGGNWVVEGLIGRLLQDDEDARRFLDAYCVYVMPMANKDGVAAGRTRFNMLGKDLNRNWDRPADARYAPENRALESWIESMIREGKRPHLMIDFHNDAGGRLHVSRPNVDLTEYLARMEHFEQLLRKHTWFTEGSTGGGFHNPGSIGEGLLERYGIVACVQELNANWIAGLEQHPSGENWRQFGEGLCQVFFEYFQSAGTDVSGGGK